MSGHADLSGTTGVLGVIGYPIEHSLSPAMHNAALQKLNLDYVYVPFAVAPASLPAAIAGMRALGIRGLNVTIPHKVAVKRYLDEIDPTAEMIGAVNTICNEAGRLIGYNTDGEGFLRSLREEGKTDPQGKTVVMLGAGGAARALGFHLALSGVKRLIIANRTVNRATALCQEIAAGTGCSITATALSDVDSFLPEADILINTTSLGMYPNNNTAPPVDVGRLPTRALVYDIVYNPRETVFLQRARAAGKRVLPGLGMLVYQGAAALELWLGVAAPVDVMKEVLRRHLLAEERP